MATFKEQKIAIINQSVMAAAKNAKNGEVVCLDTFVKVFDAPGCCDYLLFTCDAFGHALRAGYLKFTNDGETSIYVGTGKKD